MRNKGGGIVRWVIILALLFFGYTKALPWVKEKNFFGSKATAAGVDPSCTELAGAASDAWGQGLAQFVNPPVDREAWNAFRSDVELRIDRAQKPCQCNAESCVKASDAMARLRQIVSAVDSAVQTGAVLPSDLPQQQEQIDNLIDEADALVREGK